MKTKPRFLIYRQVSWTGGNYAGSERKRKYTVGTTAYMVELPDSVRDLKNQQPYMNSRFSEQAGCHIHQSIEIAVQRIFLAPYQYGDREVALAACYDFANDGVELYPMKCLHSADPFSTRQTAKVTVSILYEMMRDLGDGFLTHQAVEHYWNMFVIDYLIGNYDRHLENWGKDLDDRGVRFPVPVYDCGFFLLALESDEELAGLIGQPGVTGIFIDIHNIVR